MREGNFTSDDGVPTCNWRVQHTRAASRVNAALPQQSWLCRRTLIAHPTYLPLSQIGATYSVNMHVMRFAAAPSALDTSPPKLGRWENLATHLLPTVQGGS